MNLEVETDKRLNIYTIWEGEQIILCKGKRKYSEFGNKKWVLFWPTTDDEKKLIKREESLDPFYHKISDLGYNKLNIILSNPKKSNRYIAEVEYYEAFLFSPKLWDAFYKLGEFILWDIDDGPMKYFKDKKTQLIAIYRVYKIPFEIQEEDIQRINGKMPPYDSKKLNAVVSKEIKSLLNLFKPVLTDEEFNERKKKILNIIGYNPLLF